MQVIEFLVLNKKTWLLKVRTNIFLAILFIMILYWILINIALLITVIINKHQWVLISGFNFGFLGSIIGLLFLCLASKWLTSNILLKQTVAYFGFLLRMIVYSSIILLIIFFNFANLCSAIAGMSVLMMATITASLCVYQKNIKEGI